MNKYLQKISIRQALNGGIGLLTLLMLYNLGSLTAHIVHRQILSMPLPAVKNLGNRMASNTDASAQPKTAFAPILDQNVFNAKRSEVRIQLGNFDPNSMTTLNLELIGTILMGDWGYGIIARKGTLDGQPMKTNSCFRLSDMIVDASCPTEAVKIISVEDRRVQIEYQGNQEWLVMKDDLKPSFDRVIQTTPTVASVASPQAQDPATPPQAPNSIAELPTPTDDQEVFRFQSDWVNQQLEDWGKFLQDARVVAFEKEKKTYFRFKQIKEGSIYEKLGLKKDDILLEINGSPIDNPSKGLALMNALKSEREIVLKIERDRKVKVLRYYIE